MTPLNKDPTFKHLVETMLILYLIAYHASPVSEGDLCRWNKISVEVTRHRLERLLLSGWVSCQGNPPRYRITHKGLDMISLPWKPEFHPYEWIN